MRLPGEGRDRCIFCSLSKWQLGNMRSRCRVARSRPCVHCDGHPNWLRGKLTEACAWSHAGAAHHPVDRSGTGCDPRNMTGPRDHPHFVRQILFDKRLRAEKQAASDQVDVVPHDHPEPCFLGREEFHFPRTSTAMNQLRASLQTLGVQNRNILNRLHAQIESGFP